MKDNHSKKVLGLYNRPYSLYITHLNSNLKIMLEGSGLRQISIINSHGLMQRRCREETPPKIKNWRLIILKKYWAYTLGPIVYKNPLISKSKCNLGRFRPKNISFIWFFYVQVPVRVCWKRRICLSRCISIDSGLECLTVSLHYIYGTLPNLRHHYIFFFFYYDDGVCCKGVVNF